MPYVITATEPLAPLARRTASVADFVISGLYFLRIRHPELSLVVVRLNLPLKP